MIIKLKSGEMFEKLEVPDENISCFLKPNSINVDKDEKFIINEALDNPIGSQKLEEFLDKDSKIAIVVDDATRPTPTNMILDVLLKKLEIIGIPDSNINITIANGLHRKATEEEKYKMFGDKLSRFDISDNKADNPDNYVYYGKTSKGAPLYFNKRVTEADLVITLGIIKSHAFAGFTGGAKSILPGISNKETVLSNHTFENIKYPNGILGNCELSKSRNAMEEAAKKLPIYIINVVLDEEKKVCGAISGDVIEAHRKGIEFFKKMASFEVEKQFDVALVEGGLPGSISLYQALFGCNVVLTTERPSIKPGGTVIIFAQCKEGLGSDIIERLFREYKTADGVLDHLENSPVEIGQWAAQFLAAFIKRVNIVFVTEGLTYEQMDILGIKNNNSAKGAIEKVLKENNKAKIAIIKEPDFLIVNVKK